MRKMFSLLPVGRMACLCLIAYVLVSADRIHVKFYDIIKDGILSADPSQKGGKKVTKMPSSISIAMLLGGVKDKNGKPYVVGGKLKYEPGVLGEDTKYSIGSDITKQYPHWMDNQTANTDELKRKNHKTEHGKLAVVETIVMGVKEFRVKTKWKDPSARGNAAKSNPVHTSEYNGSPSISYNILYQIIIVNQLIFCKSSATVVLGVLPDANDVTC